MLRLLNIFLATTLLCVVPLSNSEAGRKGQEVLKKFEAQRVHNSTALEKTGAGLRTATLGVKVYAIAHYAPKNALPSPATYTQVAQADVPKEIVMIFMRKVSAKKIKSSYEKSIKSNNSDAVVKSNDKTIQAFLNAMNVEMKKGDKFELFFMPKKGLKVTTPQGVTMINTSDEIGKIVWNVWFGPKPPSPGERLQKKLIKNL